MSNSTKAVRIQRGLFLSLGVILVLLVCGALSAQDQNMPVRNVVLVHGAWADGSGWKGVYDILVKDGYNVSIVQEPETSFREDVQATKRMLALQDGPCILVAPSPRQAWRAKPTLFRGCSQNPFDLCVKFPRYFESIAVPIGSKIGGHPVIRDTHAIGALLNEDGYRRI